MMLSPEVNDDIDESSQMMMMMVANNTQNTHKLNRELSEAVFILIIINYWASFIDTPIFRDAQLKHFRLM